MKNVKNYHKILLAVYFIATGISIGLGLADVFSKWYFIFPLFFVIVGLLGIAHKNTNVGNCFSLLFAVVGAIWCVQIFVEFPFDILGYCFAGLMVFAGACILINVFSEKSQAKATTMIFGSRKIFVDEMKSETITLMLATLTLDYRKAQIKEDITLNIGVMFGGVEIKIPQDVNLVFKSSNYVSSLILPKDIVLKPDCPTITLYLTSVLASVSIRQLSN